MAGEPLLNLPEELFERILDHVDSAKDLLSFALTRRQLYQIIVPHHLGRNISLNYRHEASWSFLAQYPLLASRIRELRLTDSNKWRVYGEIIPHDLRRLFEEVPLDNIYRMTELTKERGPFAVGMGNLNNLKKLGIELLHIHGFLVVNVSNGLS